MSTFAMRYVLSLCGNVLCESATEIMMMHVQYSVCIFVMVSCLQSATVVELVAVQWHRVVFAHL